ncbi:MFS general substrate transporter [Laetiporus sulphureus 93-53]|uniref:MFS general substrate transporter n=1 Tax=Laetiporus sulphureus 93-53 TaxID=1314785 RepID=A0A165H983_9APHY|nr:MFS general substrate transporter [Laetiporus sulphureus 93-53]KZT11418.1 MFS general substrate transporter [Laetiporus sulphureus 93-53]
MALKQGDAIELDIVEQRREFARSRTSISSGKDSLRELVHETENHARESAAAQSVKSKQEAVSRGAISAVRFRSFRQHSKVHFVTLLYSYFLQGFNDGSLGPLLPRIQRHYDIGFDIASLLFICMTLGFIGGAIMNIYLNERLGFGKVVVIGLGAFVSPLVATHFAFARHWSFHYVVAASIAASNIVALAIIFRFRQQAELMEEAGQTVQTTEETAAPEGNVYRQILRRVEIHVLAIFCLIYVGVEVSIGGWIVTFIEDKRDGGATAGYISSGFFGGLMLGRIALIWLNRKLGERLSIIVYGLSVIALEVTVWVVPSLLENAVAASLLYSWFRCPAFDRRSPGFEIWYRNSPTSCCFDDVDYDCHMDSSSTTASRGVVCELMNATV